MTGCVRLEEDSLRHEDGWQTSHYQVNACISGRTNTAGLTSPMHLFALLCQVCERSPFHYVRDEFRIAKLAQCQVCNHHLLSQKLINHRLFADFLLSLQRMMLKSYKFRIYPSRVQNKKLCQTLDLCCELYNAALKERRDAYKLAKISLNYHSQAIQLPEIKESRSEFGNVHSQILQDTLKRLDKAFAAFFRRVNAGDKAGFPRFRSRSRYNSFTFPQSGFAIESGKLKLSKIGKVKIKLHREIEGKIKTCAISQSPTGKWFACLSVECEAQALPASKENIGIDVGLKAFAVLSNGEAIANPKFFRKAEKRLAKAQKKLSAAAKGSRERQKQRNVVVHIHERIANRRRDFAHQESRKLVNRFGLIVFEKLNIRGMLKNHCFAKSIADASWSQLVTFTSYKAENAGRRVVQVNPRNTSQMCSRCGALVKKDLSVRIHNCPRCGLVLDRDHNSAISILALGLQSIGQQTIEAAFLSGSGVVTVYS